MSNMQKGQKVIGRFAPSPSGRMHAGNVFAALCAWLIAKLQDGDIVLRVEDLDAERSKGEFADQILRDFEALGLYWDEGPYYQQGRQEAYEEAFDNLARVGVVYPCFCTRTDLHAASAPHASNKQVYAGTCRHRTDEERAALALSRTYSHRLAVPDEMIRFIDQIQGASSFNLATDCGDFIIKRFDGSFAYQLAVVIDDASQGVNSVVRGVDLLDSTPQQMYIRQLLDLPSAEYAHVPLIVAPDGRRLAKRNKDAALDQMIGRYGSPQAVVGHVAHLAGLIDRDDACTPDELRKALSLEELLAKLQGRDCIVFE